MEFDVVQFMAPTELIGSIQHFRRKIDPGDPAFRTPVPEGETGANADFQDGVAGTGIDHL